MRIIHLVSTADGGMRHHVSDLVTTLADMEHEVVTLGPSVLRRIVCSGPDILHCHGFRASWAGRGLCGSLRHRPAVAVTVHGLPGPAAGLSANPCLMRLMETRLAPFTHGIIAVSEFLARELIIMGVPRSLISVIPASVDLSSFRPHPRQSNGSVIVGTAGRLAKEKEIDILLRSVALCVSNGHDIAAVIAGDGPAERDLQQLTGELGIGSRVTFLGRLDRGRMPAFYQSLDLFALCGRREGQSLATVEAMASGLPVLVPASGALNELVTPGTGLCLPPGNPHQLAAALSGLAEDSRLRRELGRRAAAKVREKYSPVRWGEAMRSFYRRLRPGLLAVIVALAIGSGSVSASPTKSIVVVADGLTASDLAQMPAVSRLSETGAAGLMNVGTAGRRTRAESWLTVGAGHRAVLSESLGADSPEGRLSWGETAGDAFARRTGLNPAGADAVNPDINLVRSENEGGAKAGALSDALAAGGVPMVAIGSSDVPGQRHRPAALIAADSSGIVTHAVVEGLTAADADGPYGTSIDVTAVVAAAGRSGRPSVVVIDFGDLWRLEQERILLGDRYRELRTKALARLDALVGQIAGECDLIILTSFVAGSVGMRAGLAPIVINGGDFKPGSLLWSPTTKRAGLVANTDLAPTLLTAAGCTIPAGMTGRALSSTPAPGGNLDYMLNWGRRVVATHAARAPIVRGYILILIVSLAGLAALVCWHGPHPAGQLVMLVLLAAPLAMLIVPAVSPPVAAGVLMIGASVALAGGGWMLSRRRTLIGPLLLCLITSGVVVIDQLVGGQLALHSVLGYSPISGARYYGLGNELAGVFLGSSVMGAGLGLELARRTGTALSVGLAGVALSVLVVGNPAVGANFGGSIGLIAAWVAFSVDNRARGTWTLPLGLAAAVSAAAAVAWFDSLRSPQVQTHLGRMYVSLSAGQWEQVSATVLRKLDLNLRLVRYTVWSRALVALVGLIFILSRRPIGAYRALANDQPALGRAVRAATFGAGVCLVANDSGVIAAATAMIYVTMVLGYSLLSRPQGEGDGRAGR